MEIDKEKTGKRRKQNPWIRVWQPRVCFKTCGGCHYVIPPRRDGGLELLLLAHFHVRWLITAFQQHGVAGLLTLNIAKMHTRFTWAVTSPERPW